LFINAQNGQQKPSLGQKNKGVKWVGSLLEIAGLEKTAEDEGTGAGTESWRERVPDFMSYSAKTASAKWLGRMKNAEGNYAI